jgi:DNA primase catalytic subunit
MNRQDVVEYYSNEKIIAELIKNAKNREVAGAFLDGRYDQRPNIIQFPSDVVQMARKGITSFHFSVEHWSNPMAIATDNYERLRTGWDLIFDIDSKLGIEESKLAATHICNLLRKYSVKNFGLKFSGRRGFHISISWKCFPKEIDYKPLEKQYPDVPRIVAHFIREKIRADLLKDLVRSKGATKLIEIIGESPSELDPFYFIEVEKDWGNRHMFRAPFSFNEKTWLVSTPISFSSLGSFTPKDAEWENVLKQKHPEFFTGEEGEAADLLTDAIDWNAAQKKEEVKKEIKPRVKWEKKVPEEMFPPCMKAILSGLSDGKKRSVFTLVNFLKMMNWTHEEIEARIQEWNKSNTPPIPNAIVLSTIRYHDAREPAPPANCFNDMYYKSFGVCRPDDICRKMNEKKLSNPIAYPFKIMKRPSSRKRGFSCGVCNKEFRSQYSLSVHKGRMH